MTSDRILTIERDIPAGPEAVYDAWTTPELLAKWWGPEGVTIPEYELDVRPGGQWRTVMQMSDGGQRTVSGAYVELNRPHRLVMTWAWTQDDGTRGHETEITVTFEPRGHGTKMKLVQQIFAEAEQARMHNMGWGSSFNCLEALFAEANAA